MKTFRYTIPIINLICLNNFSTEQNNRNLFVVTITCLMDGSSKHEQTLWNDIFFDADFQSINDNQPSELRPNAHG